MFLTKDELKELTDLERPTAQIRWLNDNGYRFEVSAAGRPKVLTSAVTKRLGEAGRKKPATPHFERI